MPWCPKCRAEYREGFTECSECHIPLVDELTDETPAESPLVLPDGIKQPIAVYVAPNRLEAETVCDLLRDNDIVVLDRPAAFRQIQSYSGADARFGVELLVDASQTARARRLIDEMNRELAETPVDEDELARLAEEQAMETPERPAEDNASFKLLPVIAGVIALALALLYLVSTRM